MCNARHSFRHLLKLRVRIVVVEPLGHSAPSDIRPFIPAMQPQVSEPFRSHRFDRWQYCEMLADRSIDEHYRQFAASKILRRRLQLDPRKPVAVPKLNRELHFACEQLHERVEFCQLVDTWAEPRGELQQQRTELSCGRERLKRPEVVIHHPALKLRRQHHVPRTHLRMRPQRRRQRVELRRMPRQQFVQLHIKHEAVWSLRAPPLDLPAIRNAVEAGIQLHEFELARVPAQPRVCGQTSWVPVADELRVRPACGANKDPTAHVTKCVLSKGFRLGANYCLLSSWPMLLMKPVLLTAVSFALLIANVKGGAFRAGAAAVNITPPRGTPLAGYYSLRAAEDVLDDLFAKALVIEQDGAKSAVVVCDLLTLPRHVVLAARERIEDQTRIPGAHVLIAATHAHTGPVVARESARDGVDGSTTDLGRRFTDNLPALIAQSVADANARLVPANALAASTKIENLAFNRRFWMADGTVGWNPPKLSPNIIAPAGPHDPEVGMLVLETAEKQPRPISALVNYAMHPDTTGGVRISADFPGVLARRLAEFKGSDMVTLFANGCSGNLNHRNVWWADPQKGPGETARLGNILAGAVSAAWPQLAPAITAAPRTRSEIVELPLPEITPADIDEAREIARRPGGARVKFMDQVRAFRVLDVTAREGKPQSVEVQVIALGNDLALVSLPGEIFVELGLAIKKASPFKHTFIAELANGSIGYIPNHSAYAEGNYEVVSARCAAGSGEMLVDAAVRMLRELKRQ